MTVLAEKPTGLGGTYVLVDYGENFFAYGLKVDMHRVCGFPVNQCGRKEKVLNHCKAISKLCKQHIEKYEKEFAKDNHEGWKVLIDHERKHLEALTEFVSILEERE